MHKPNKSKKRYLQIEYELKNCENWPKFGEQLPISSILRKENEHNITNITRNNHCPINIKNNRMASEFSNSIQLSRKEISEKNGVENLGFEHDQVSYI